MIIKHNRTVEEKVPADNSRPDKEGLLRRHRRLALFLFTSGLLGVLFLLFEVGLLLLGFDYTRKPDNWMLADTFQMNERGLFVANPSSKNLTGMGINRDGFRSPDFDLPQTTNRQAKTVVLIGDSFTWGATANPITRSFADLVRAEGYRVHNLGIPGLGPRQYRRVAEEYMARLKPDVLIVCLFLGNDFIDAEWETPAGRLPYYLIGETLWIRPHDDAGNYIDRIDAAYEFTQNKKGWLRRQMRQTAVGTLVLMSCRNVIAWSNERKAHSLGLETAQSDRSKPLGMAREQAHGMDPRKRFAPAYQALDDIQAMARKHGAEFHTLVIPALGLGCLESTEFGLDSHRAALAEFNPVYIDVSSRNYNGMRDCHFNNEGHQIAAAALIQLLGPTTR